MKGKFIFFLFSTLVLGEKDKKKSRTIKGPNSRTVTIFFRSKKTFMAIFFLLILSDMQGESRKGENLGKKCRYLEVIIFMKNI